MPTADRVSAYGPPGDLILHTLVDHLLPECPILRRLCRGQQPIELACTVDPLGTDLCGWCVRVWKARNLGVTPA